MQLAIGVIAGEVAVEDTPFACPLLVAIGVFLSCPLQLEMAPLLSALPQVKVKSVAATSVEVAIL